MWTNPIPFDWFCSTPPPKHRRTYPNPTFVPSNASSLTVPPGALYRTKNPPALFSLDTYQILQIPTAPSIWMTDDERETWKGKSIQGFDITPVSLAAMKSLVEQRRAH